MLENGRNNGSLYLSVRDATDRVGLSDKRAVQNAFDELIDRGLIVCTKAAHFAIKAAEHSRARCWRLTWVPAENRAATNDWEAYEPPPKTKSQRRCERGMRALKRHKRQQTSHRLPVAESRTMNRYHPPPDTKPVQEARTANHRKRGNTPIRDVMDSTTHAAVTITRPSGEWWRARPYLRLPDQIQVALANDI